jgi:hypothetical protein
MKRKAIGTMACLTRKCTSGSRVFHGRNNHIKDSWCNRKYEVQDKFDLSPLSI